MPIRAAKLQQTIGMTNKFLRVFLKYFLTDVFMPSRARIYIRSNKHSVNQKSIRSSTQNFLIFRTLKKHRYQTFCGKRYF